MKGKVLMQYATFSSIPPKKKPCYQEKILKDCKPQGASDDVMMDTAVHFERARLLLENNLCPSLPYCSRHAKSRVTDSCSMLSRVSKCSSITLCKISLEVSCVATGGMQLLCELRSTHLTASIHTTWLHIVDSFWLQRIVACI